MNENKLKRIMISPKRGTTGMDSIPLRINESSNDIENRIEQLVEYAISVQMEKRTVNGENETVNRKIKVWREGLKSLLFLILHNQGVNRKTLNYLFGKSDTRVHRYIKILKDAQIVEFIGADKTGGYHLTSSAQEILSQKSQIPRSL